MSGRIAITVSCLYAVPGRLANLVCDAKKGQHWNGRCVTRW